MAKIIDGVKIANEMKRSVSVALKHATQTRNILPPYLGFIQIGNRKDSENFVKVKSRTAQEVGFRTTHAHLPESASAQDVFHQIDAFNQNPDVAGFLVQLPIPSHIPTCATLARINPNKDVDGLHPFNVGTLWCNGMQPFFTPCAATSVVEVLRGAGFRVEGSHAVVIGCSQLLGLPTANLLLNASASVTITHDKSNGLKDIVRQADIIVSAAGHPHLVRGDWIKPGAFVIDVGINCVPDTTRAGGFRLCGDVHYEEVSKVAGYITPVPGGVGPVTVAMLMKNTLTAFLRQIDGSPGCTVQPYPDMFENKSK